VVGKGCWGVEEIRGPVGNSHPQATVRNPPGLCTGAQRAPVDGRVIHTLVRVPSGRLGSLGSSVAALVGVGRSGACRIWDAVRRSVELEAVSAVTQAVDGGGAQRAIDGEGVGPLVRVQITGQDGRAALVAVGDELVGNDGAAQHTIPIKIRGEPYLIFADEFGSGGFQSDAQRQAACTSLRTAPRLPSPIIRPAKPAARASSCQPRH
jgi:hypothetical protein